MRKTGQPILLKGNFILSNVLIFTFQAWPSHRRIDVQKKVATQLAVYA